MKQLLSVIFSLLASLTIYAQSANNQPKYLDISLDFETRALDLVQQMTLEEKISQLGNKAPAIPRLGIKEYEWWNESLHGVARAGTATVFPQAIGMAATFDTDMMRQVATIISDEARAKHHEAQRNKNYDRYFGLTFWSPNINIFRDPRWGRGHETYGEDPYLTGQMGMQFVKGLQGNDPKYLKVVATAKHFAVHNGPEPDRHSFNAVPNTRDLWETYLPAFEDLMVNAKAYSIMSAYNRIDGESSSASWLLLEDILRNKWGFDGYVVSDCGAIDDIYRYHKIVNSLEEAAAIGLRKGCDLNCGNVYQKNLKNAIKLGFVDEGEIDRSLYRLILAKMKLGMFDPEEMVPYAQIPFSVNNSEPHDKMALKMAQKSMTLLKNDGILPLNKNKIKHIAVVGPNANSIVALRGNYHGEASNPVTVIDGIKKAMGKKAKITFYEGVPLVADKNLNQNYSIIDAKYLSTTDAKGKKVQGLTGQYFNNKKLEGKPDFTRIDAQINFKWDGSPTATEVAQGILNATTYISGDNFSVRWTGKLQVPQTGNYKLGMVSDDGCRIWIDGKKIADGWSDHASSAYLGDIQLETGKAYDITLEYYENSGGAESLLVWETPMQTKTTKQETLPKLSKKTLSDIKKADVAIFVGGLDANWEGEEMGGRINIDGFNKGDRTKIELPKVQLEAMKDMVKTGTPVVLVLMAGSAIAFDGLENELDAILMGWYPGQRGGDAIANVLFGDYNPAGRLPVTFYKSTRELPNFSDYNMRAGKGFTYKYYKGDALYPFGHGLSYSNFEYSNLNVDKTNIESTDTITVSIDIKNNGKKEGEEVVQLYVKDVKSDKWMPKHQLREFKRIKLKKGETKTVEFILSAKEDFRYYDAMYRKYTVEPGSFEIQIGASSKDIRQSKTVIVKE